MIYINLESNPPDLQWIKKADTVTAKLIAEGDAIKRNELIKTYSKLWGELKDFLSALSHEKCWYTESKNPGSYCHVDHFRPKTEAIDEIGNDIGGYWWLAFDWMNYRYSGPAANVKKSSYFQVIQDQAKKYGDNIKKEQILFLDPINFSDPDHLAFNNEGMAQPKSSDKKSINYLRAEYSIRRLNINFYKIVDSRKGFYNKATITILKIEKLLSEEAINPDYGRQQDISDLMKSLWEMCCRNAEYSAAVKYCLRSTGHEWALKIIAKAA